MSLNKREVLFGMVAGLAAAATAHGQTRRPPNVVIVLADDLGYGDLSLHGAPSINTPNIDRLAHEGLEITSFYTAPVCTPTRGMLLTGRYPPRTGLYSPTGPKDPGGIRATELTIADLLKKQGYRTAMFGKWHLGDFENSAQYNPVNHGFDRFLGIPYSHDYNPPDGVPLFDGLKKVAQPIAYQTLTKRLTEGAVDVINTAGDQPFFIYLAHPMPHVPVGSSEAFKGHSRGGRYGDAVEEVDWSVGEVLKAVKARGLDQDTLVLFLSDNGPWALVGEKVQDRGPRGSQERGDVGNSGQMRGSKTSVWEGGVRVPAVFRWPGHIPAGRRTADIASVLDLLPTVVGLAGGKPPADRTLDGLDIADVLTKGAASPRHEQFFWLGRNLLAVRQGPWKLQVPDATSAAISQAVAAADPVSMSPELVAEQATPTEPALFNVETDPAERYNRAAEHPDIVARLTARLAQARDALASDRALPQPD